MTMKEFAEVIKKSRIVGNNTVKIIQELFKAAGAEEAVSGWSKTSSLSPSPTESTVKKWFNGSRPGVSRYFPTLRIENKERAHGFLLKTPKKDQWKELRELFREWRNDHKSTDEDFCINTETENFTTFSTSFWRQFASFFDSLKIWDDTEELYSEIGTSQEDDTANEMVRVFGESFTRHKVYEYLPEDIDIVIDSLEVYNEMWKELKNKGESKRLYCKWFLGDESFMLCAAICCGEFWKIEMQEKSILLKFDEIFDYEKLPTNEWLTGTFKYAFGNHDIPDNETLSWKECWGKIIIVDINSLANWDNPADDANLLIEDWYMLIDDILELDSMIDEFTEDINDKIVEKYEGVTLDNKSRVRYNGIKRYGKALKKFKEYLGEFRNLQKQKDEYHGK